MKTYVAKPRDVERLWYLVDAENKVLGRLASEIASRLRGKHKPIFTPHVDTGDFVVVVNAGKIKVTGNKADDKIYYRHTGYPGGIRKRSFKEMEKLKPGQALRLAVKGMLPKGALGYSMLKKLKVYADGDHPHKAQHPPSLPVAGDKSK